MQIFEKQIYMEKTIMVFFFFFVRKIIYIFLYHYNCNSEVYFCNIPYSIGRCSKITYACFIYNINKHKRGRCSRYMSRKQFEKQSSSRNNSLSVFCNKLCFECPLLIRIPSFGESIVT